MLRQFLDYKEQAMKLKYLTIFLGVLCYATTTSAQENFTFQNLMSDTVHLVFDHNDVGTHYLGHEMAVKFYRLKETYTYLESGSDANPVSKTVVSKPNIYYSLKKLNTYYKKQLKRGEIDSSSAVKQLGLHFDIGFAIYEQNTSDLESALKGAKKPEQILDVFAQVILE